MNKKDTSRDIDRLKAIMLYVRSKSWSDLADKINLDSPQVFYNITNGRCNITYRLAFAIVERYPEIRMDWILHGEGSMLKEVVNITQTKDNSVRGNNNVMGNNNTIMASEETFLFQRETIRELRERIVELNKTIEELRNDKKLLTKLLSVCTTNNSRESL